MGRFVPRRRHETRDSVFFSLTNADHPVAGLSKTSYRARLGQVNIVSLTVREVSRVVSSIKVAAAIVVVFAAAAVAVVLDDAIVVAPPGLI